MKARRVLVFRIVAERPSKARGLATRKFKISIGTYCLVLVPQTKTLMLGSSDSGLLSMR